MDTRGSGSVVALGKEFELHRGGAGAEVLEAWSAQHGWGLHGVTVLLGSEGRWGLVCRGIWVVDEGWDAVRSQGVVEGWGAGNGHGTVRG